MKILTSKFVCGALYDEEMATHQGHSIHYRISVGPHQGKKVFSLKTLPPIAEEIQSELLGEVAGFSFSEQRLSLTEQGNICYALKTAYRNGKS